MIEHRAPVSGIAAFRDRYVATAGYDNQLILWDAATKKALSRSVHDHLANQCAFSPDGKYLASASSDYSARLWSLPDLRLEAVFKHHQDDVEMVAFHPTRPLIATASRDHRVRIFGFDGALERELAAHQADVISVDWVKGEDQVISSSDDGTIKRWDAASGRLLEDVDMRGVETDTIALSPAGVIYAGNDEGRIAIIERGTVRSFEAHRAGIKRLAYDADLGRLLSISYDRTFKLWRISGAELALELTGDLPSIIWPRSCAFLGKTKIVFGTFGTSYATFDLSARRMDTSGVDPTWGRNAVAVIGEDEYAVGDAGVVFKNGKHERDLGSLCNFLTPVGEHLLTGGQMGILFDARSGTKIHQHRSPLNCGAAFVEEGVLRAVVGTYTGEGLIFRAKAGGALELEREIQLHDNAIKGVAVAKGVIFSVCATGAASFHSSRTYERVRSVERAHDKIANGCTAIPGADGAFASVSRDLSLRIWRNGAVERISTPHTHSIKCIAAAASGRFLATGSYDGHVAVYDVEARRWVHTEQTTASGVSSLCAYGEAFLASSYDGNVYRITSHVS